ncbi:MULTISPECIES: hypothetical protein [unclassified Bacillus (in: firmicutes)]|uniref:hypothetical protein n=1 Tax=unclassified Bacillus (in: firmicutes) TaxID=185979 RepID=UPI001BE5265A|nr:MULTISPECIES: hypothetical protein [unclassified Bacillus (in: firmicutes)]MBT2618667.1 hypothetical protein [Bacillus sp. ISL-78]MBT2719211.1 hypothetical protein [Bacillus sp. ISL-57]
MKTYQDTMKKEGVSGRMDLEKQFHTLGKMEARVPEVKGQIQAQEKGLDLFGTIRRALNRQEGTCRENENDSNDI